ncbi:MAG: hypothetical protein ABIW79_07940 [Gemmatimonas sp.]
MISRRSAIPALITFAVAWWLLVPLSVGFGLRWLFTGYTSAAGSVFNPADPSVYMLWLKVGLTAGAAMAIHEAGASGSRTSRPHRARRRLPGRLIPFSIASAMSAPFVIQHVEAHATRIPYLALFALCGALCGIVCNVLLKHMQAASVDEAATQPS